MNIITVLVVKISRILGVTMGCVLLPLSTQAQVNSWTFPVSGAWETGGNWSLGVAPSNNSAIYLTNDVSKTVMISASTPVNNLTISNLFVEAPAGATNTLLLSSNTSPFILLACMTLGNTAGKVGAFVVDSGLMVAQVATPSVVVGNSGIGVMTVLSGISAINPVVVGNASGGKGTLYLQGGIMLQTNGTSKFTLGSGAGSTGMVFMTGGMLLATNGALPANKIGESGFGGMTVSGGMWLVRQLTVGENSGAQGTLNISGGTVETFGTFNVGAGSNSTGGILISGGKLTTTNSPSFTIGNKGVGSITVSNGTLIAATITLGNTPTNDISSKGTLTIAGGEVGASTIIIGGGVGASNHTVLVTGGVLEANTITCNWPGNVISNAGGVYQFTFGTPTIPTNRSVAINGGTMAFRGGTTFNVRGNQAGTALTNIMYYGQNAFRLNAASNNTVNQSYTFASNMGATNYARLELVNATTCYRGGDVTLGTGGSILFSNTTAMLNGSFTNNGGGMAVVDSLVTITGACVIVENSTLSWGSNTMGGTISVNGQLTLPTHATFSVNGPIGRSQTWTLFTSPNTIAGSPANWTVTTTSHQLAMVGNTLVLRPRSSGFVLKVQ